MEVKYKTAVEELFDRDSHEYLCKHLTPENIREKERIVSLLSNGVKYENLLDIGCGPGTISNDLLAISSRVWGMDISQDMINIAIDKFNETQFNEKVHFEVGDAEQLKFPDEYFDAVVCVGVLRYLNSRERGLQEIYRVLKPNGVVVMTFYYQFSPHWFSMYFLYRPLLPLISLVKRRSLRDCLLKYKAEPLPFSYRKFKEMFSKSGFRAMEVQHSGFDIFPLNRLFPRLSRYVYLKAESALFSSNRLGWLGSICIVKGVK
jgi:demethylmenaquinone methyltransferase / 2-methoxy-6-polyprenyl-1,4-benzoquinol methylase